MKKRWSIVAACLLIIVCAIGLAACNPNDDGGGTTPEETISGTYYLYDNGYIKNDYFRFNEDGTFNRVNGTYNLSGTYTVSDSTITIIAEESGEQISASFTVSNGIFKVTNNGISYYYCKEGKTPSGDTPTPPSDGETVEYDGMTFEKLSDGTYSLKHGKVGSVEIPNSINGVPVSQISEMAFMSSEATINVYIPETVKNVGKNAFYRSSVKTIYCQSPNKPQGWSDDWNLRNSANDCIPVYWNINENTCSKQGDGIYILENGNTTLVEYNDEQSAISVPNSVTIGNSSYSVTAIGAGVFGGNRFIREVILPDSLREIRSGAFINTEIAEITLPEALLTIEDNAFGGCFNLGEIQIPNTVTNIGDRAFYGCQNLETVTIGNSVLLIGNEAFGRCNLKTLTFAHATHWYLASSADAAEGTAMSSIVLKNPTKAAQLMSSETGRYWKNTGEYDVVFKADGNQVGIDTYSVDDKTINEPEVPTKNGYTGAWEEYTLFGDMTINAVYTPIEYTATFVVDDDTIETKTFTVQDRGDSWFPSVPNKVGYSGKWEKSYLPLEDVTVRAVYTPIIYSVSFVADGQTVGSDTYTVEDKNITVPTVPDKTGYTGAWESYTLTTGDMTVNAVYTPITYTVTFVADERTVGSDTYTVEDKNISVPAVPEKTGYAGVWENYTLSTGDRIVNAEYTPISYTVTFVADGKTVGSDTYTVEDKNISVPAVPKKTGFVGEWESYTLTTGDKTVNALYTSAGATEGLKYALSNNSYAVSGYEGTDTQIVIPEIYRGISVTAIGANAFNNFNGLTNLTIPRSVVSIDVSAFSSCNNLESLLVATDNLQYQSLDGILYTKENPSFVLIPKGLKGDVIVLHGITAIGNSDFAARRGLTGITIPDSVISIGDLAFSECSGLANIVISDSVTSIDHRAFNNCNVLTDVVLPATAISVIPKNALKSVRITSGNIGVELKNCVTLENVIIDSNVKYVYDGAFSGCSGLTSITIPFAGRDKDAEDFYANFGYIFGETEYIGGIATKQENSLGSRYEKTYYIPESLKSVTFTGETIPYGAFSNCVGIGNISISTNLISIGVSAFSGCKELASFTIPDSVTGLGSYAFYGCSGLTNVTIGNSITSISSSAFYGCSGLTSIMIPSSVTSISSNAFSGCSGLTSISVVQDNTKYHSIGNCVIETSTKTLVFGCATSIIPSDDSVTSIGNDAFEGCSGLINITVPNGVTSIGSYAFSGCNSLTNITIPNSVTNISWNAFEGCSGLQKVTISDLAAWCKIGFYNATSNPLYYSSNFYLNDKVIISLEIPDGVTSISNYAFNGFKGIGGIIIPNSVTSIGSSTFSGCDNIRSARITTFAISYIPKPQLQTVVITSGEAIPEKAFENCNSLTSVILGNVNVIGDYAFRNCSKITELKLGFQVESIGDAAFSGCSGLTSITIPQSVTIIGSSAFDGCSGLTSIVISDSVTTIGSYAFRGCNNITKATYPAFATSYVPKNNLKSVIITSGDTIGSYAFSGCSGLTSITIPESVTSIGNSAFSGCSGLTSITIPNGVTSIGNSTFSGCSGLTSITIPNGVTSIGNSTFSGCSGLTSITIPQSVTTIDSSSFSGCSGLTSITIPQSVTTIGSSAFSRCSGLTNITIPNGVTSIGNSAFSECSGLKSITIPFVGATKDGTQNAYVSYIFGEVPSSLKTVIITGGTSIASEAFRGCSGLTSVTIPDSVTRIDMSAFWGCSGLTSLIVSEGNTKYHSAGNCIIATSSKTLSHGCNTSIIPSDGSVTSIGAHAFSQCNGLTSITIPASVTNISYAAFRGCSGLTSISVAQENTKYHSAGNCIIETSGKKLILGCKTSIIPSDGSVTKIDQDAFNGCSGLTSITIPESVTIIGANAFSGCSGLTSIIMGNGVLSIGSRAFSGCGGLTNITIPSSVTNIGENAFSRCSGLTSITIPKSVTIIGANAFYGCSGLTNISVAQGNSKYYSAGNCIIETLTKTLVVGCTISIIPTDNSVTSIGSSAFSGCSGLTCITIPESVTIIGANAFSDCSELTSITIPNSVTSIGYGALNNCRELTNITYDGTRAQWQAISKEINWDYGIRNYTITCIDGTISK